MSKTENTSWWCAIFAWPLVSIRCEHGAFSMDISDTASVPILGNCFAILLFDGSSCTTATNYDSLFACVFEIFHAKESNKSDFQVSFCWNLFLENSEINLFFSRRSSQQIYNVTLFFLFFMSLYGLLGVQFFGELKNHCVINTTTIEWVANLTSFVKWQMSMNFLFFFSDE